MAQGTKRMVRYVMRVSALELNDHMIRNAAAANEEKIRQSEEG